MASNNVPSISSSQATIRAQMTGTDPTVGTITPPANLNISMAYGQGSTAGNINSLTAFQVALPASGSVTYNLFTGGIIPSTSTTTINNNTQTTFLLQPDGTTFTLASGVRDFMALLPAASSSSSVTINPGAASGFVGWFGASSNTENLRGGTNGGFIHRACSDSIGWPVSASLANLVFTNLSSAGSASVQLFIAGA